MQNGAAAIAPICVSKRSVAVLNLKFYVETIRKISRQAARQSGWNLKFVAEAARKPAIRLIDGRSVGTAQGSHIAALNFKILRSDGSER